jgi:HK97 family phage major capsid protein
MNKQLKELREKVGTLRDEMIALTTAETFGDEQRTQFDAKQIEVNTLEADILRFEEAEKNKRSAPQPVSMPVVMSTGTSEDDEKAKMFRFGDVLSSVMDGTPTGAVKEMHQEALRRSVASGFGKQPTSGINIPLDFWSINRRDVTAGGSTTGAKYVATQKLSFIDALRNDIVMMNMGTTMLTGLSSNISIPRKTAGAAVAAAAENTTSTETTPTVDEITLSPKRITAFTDVSNQAIIQATPDLLSLTENDLYMATLVELQRQLIHGAGSGGEMTGLLATSGIGTESTAAVTYAICLAIEEQVAADNAMTGNLGWITNTLVRKFLKSKEEFSSTGLKVWANDNTIDGYPAYATNSVSRVIGGSASALIFGNWADFIIGQFGAINLQKNVEVKSKEALTEIVIHSWWDCAVRHAESFAANVAITS